MSVVSKAQDVGMWLVDNGLYNTKKSWDSTENLINIGVLGASGLATLFTGVGGAALLTGRIAAGTGAKAVAGALGKTALKEGAEAGIKFAAGEGAETAATALTKRQLGKIGLDTAKEMRNASKSGFFGTATAPKDLVIASARDAMEKAAAKSGSKFTGSELGGMAAKAAHKAEKGGVISGAAKSVAGGVGNFAVKHPVTSLVVGGGTLAATGAVDVVGTAGNLLYGAADKVTGGNLSTIMNAAGSVTSAGASGVGQALNIGAKGLGAVYNQASGALQHMGMSPEAAGIITGLGTWFALSKMLSFTANQTGIGSFIPNLVVILGAGLLAMKIASAAAENHNAPQAQPESRPQANAAPSPRHTPSFLVPAAPAPAMQ